VASFCEHGNESSGFIEGEEFFAARATISFSVILHHEVT
jgi:hypothetical protein